MKNILKLFIGLILFVMFSCHNITNSEQETLETNNHAYISISLNENARTVLPQSADFEKDFELSFELQGQQEGKDLQTIKKWTATAEKTAYTLMTEDTSVLINTGLWNFELSVQKAGQKVLFGTLEEITIQTGTNTLNFGTLQKLTSGNGSVSVALSFLQEGRVQAVQGGLYNLDGTALEGFEKESLTITTSEKSDVRYNKENVPCGTYLVKFELFSDKEATKTMNVYTEIVQVATGFVSAAQRTLEQLNTLYTITYDLAEGEFVEGFSAQASFNQAMTVTLPTAENLLKTGYVFVGWKNDQGDTVTEIPVGTIGDLTLTAQWEINIYTISFNANGGTLTDNATQTVKHGEKIAEPSMPTREGHVFLGWYTSNDEGLTLGEIAYDFDLATIGDVYLYAKWHEHTYSEDWTRDATHHWHVSTCGHEVTEGKAEHSFGDWTTTKEASCTQEGKKIVYCTVCEYEKKETIPAKGHTFGIWEITKEPTETESGKMQSVCEVCEETVTKEIQPVPEGFRFVIGVTITGTESWTPSSEVFVSGRKLTIPDLIVSDHEVTRGEYKAVMGSDPSSARAFDKDGKELEGDAVLNNPVHKVSWYDALVYCNKRSMQENLTPCYSIDGSTNPDAWGEVPTSSNTTWNAATCDFNANGYRLPTEAEWEWLARGGENYEYAGSDNVDDVAWYTSNTNYTGTREVKTKAPNGYGLYDMSGNVYEWCYDWYRRTITTTTTADGATSGSSRVNRGGSWNSHAVRASVSYRDNNFHYCRRSDYGLRVVRPSSK